MSSRAGLPKGVRRLVLITLVAAGVAGFTLERSGPQGGAEVVLSYAAPALDDGRKVAVNELGARAVLVNGWATWCRPCREELPFLADLQTEYEARGLRVVGVSVDDGLSNGQLQAFVAGAGADYLHLTDSRNHFSASLGTTGVPESVLIDSGGRVAFRWRGPVDADASEARSVIQAVLAGEPLDRTGGAADLNLQTGAGLAALAGLLSFLSPCVLPLVPSYCAVVAGGLSTKLSGEVERRRPRLSRAALFVAGFSAVFVAFGASASWLGSLLDGYQVPLARAGGVVVVAFGLQQVGLLKIPILQREFRGDLSRARHRAAGPAGALFTGMVFAAGWTPCIGPMLAGILAVAATAGSAREGTLLLASYSAGLAVPFLIFGLGIAELENRSRLRRWLPRLEQAGGALLVFTGLLLMTGSVARLADWAPDWVG